MASVVLNNLATAHSDEVYRVARAVLRDGPVDGRAGWVVVLLFFGLFIGFAAVVRLDAAAHASGSIVFAQHRQVVQHREGGIVSAVYVREGQRVKAGDVLIELAGGDVVASEEAVASQAILLLAERARLEAELAGARGIVAPAEFAELKGRERDAATAALRQQEKELRVRSTAFTVKDRVTNRRSAEVTAQMSGLRAQIVAADERAQQLAEQVEGLERLATRGFASRNHVRDLQGARAAAIGEAAGLRADLAAASEKVGETQLEGVSMQNDWRSQAMTQLGEVVDQLAGVLPRLAELRRQRDQLRIRALTRGQVLGLEVPSPGAVIAPGQKLMEIVPEAGHVLIDAQLSPSDADDVRPGQSVEIRLPSIHRRDMPTLVGVLTSVSADSMADKTTGARFYRAEVKVAAKSLAPLMQNGGAVRAGLPAEILIPLRSRTLLDYLGEPLTGAVWRAGHEH